jgi:hypothetical protein
MKFLGMSIEDYKTSRRELVKAGLVKKGKGRGGSVARMAPQEAAAVPSQMTTLVPGKPRRKRVRKELDEYYERMKNFMDENEWDYGEITSERGKRRGNDLRAVPDVAGIKYFTGYIDKVDVHAIEVKAQKPSSYDLSEAFRYSRFADYCYIAVLKEKIRKEQYEKYKEEARRLGLGIIEYPLERAQGKEKARIVEKALKQNPDPLEKQRFLAESLAIYQCQECGCYLHKDEGQIQKSKRSHILLRSGTNEEEARRFRCNYCLKISK